VNQVQSINPGDHDIPGILQTIKRMHKTAKADGDQRLAIIASLYLPEAHDAVYTAFFTGGTLEHARYLLATFEDQLIEHGYADKSVTLEDLESTLYDLINSLT